MAWLILSGAEGTAFELRPGTSRIGRSDTNDIQINASSVSGHHCEISYDDGVLTVRDLGSTNGTFVDNTKVTECTVLPGQILKLGSIETIFRDDAATQTESAPVAETSEPPSLEPASTDDCLNHPGTAGKWICQKCHRVWCATCPKKQMVGMRPVNLCPSCQGFCTDYKAHMAEVALKSATFGQLVGQAFSYPLKGNGLLIILTGGVFFSFFDWAQQLFLMFRKLGLFMISSFMLAFILSIVLSVGYLFSFLKSIVVASANGQEKIPGWPEITGMWDDIVRPFFQCFFLWFFCLLPAGVAMIADFPVGAALLGIAGLFVVPMAFLGVAMVDSITGLNPLVILPSIFKVFGAYLITWLVMLGIFAIKGVGSWAMSIIPIPLLPTLVTTILSLYFLSVEMRILGVLYFTKQRQLAWF